MADELYFGFDYDNKMTRKYFRYYHKGQLNAQPHILLTRIWWEYTSS